MKDYFKNLLPRKIFKRVALTYRSSNIKPRFPLRLNRLTNIFSKITFLLLLLAFFAGYYPAPTFPPVKKSVAKAQESVQKQEIIAASFPQPVILPHPGYISTHFSYYHLGVDIASGLGMPVHPITAGVVEDVIYDFWDYGHHVIIDHQNGFKSLYGHLGRIYVKKGDKVTSENIIGEVGLTGHTSGPHTHLEVTRNGTYIDPLTILPAIADIPKAEYLTKAN